jgi:hypothetical protein
MPAGTSYHGKPFGSRASRSPLQLGEPLLVHLLSTRFSFALLLNQLPHNRTADAGAPNIIDCYLNTTIAKLSNEITPRQLESQMANWNQRLTQLGHLEIILQFTRTARTRIPQHKIKAALRTFLDRHVSIVPITDKIVAPEQAADRIADGNIQFVYDRTMRYHRL